MNRRSFLTGLLASTAIAPLAKSDLYEVTTSWAADCPAGYLNPELAGTPLYAELARITREAFRSHLYKQATEPFPFGKV